MVDLEGLDAYCIIGGKLHQAEGILGWRGDPNFRNEVFPRQSMYSCLTSDNMLYVFVPMYHRFLRQG